MRTWSWVWMVCVACMVVAGLSLSCSRGRPPAPAPGAPPAAGEETPAPPAAEEEVGEASASADEELRTLARWMSGYFSSEEQAAADSSYFDIRLAMEPIWTDRSDGFWLYVEQSVAGYEQRPYRQRVYHVTRKGLDAFESAVFLLPDPERYIGAWRNPSVLNQISPEDLEARTGCSIHLNRRPDGSFQGSTRNRDCPSDLRGAAYATSKVTLENGVLVSWDQGFDEEGEQVWGAVEGGYIFRKRPRPE